MEKTEFTVRINFSIMLLIPKNSCAHLQM